MQTVSILAGLTLAALGWAAPALATDEPVNQPSQVPVQEALIPDLPDFPTVWQESPVPLQLFSAPPFGPDDKGGTYTEMGAGQPARLTPREEALLALGRAAIEASRAAGTLQIRRPEPTTPPIDHEGLERQKQGSLLHPPLSVPVLGTGSPVDMMSRGAVTAPVPPVPFALTPGELQKLAAMQNRSGLVVLPRTEGTVSHQPAEGNQP
jgi:hypothetical protein